MFLHDGLGAVEAWKDLPARLCERAGARGLVYDRWGYGGSESRARFEPGFMEAEVPTLIELLDRVDAPAADLVGHSDGATIALLAAARHPDKIRSVVSVAAHTFVEPATTESITALRAGTQPAWLHRLHGERSGALLEAWAEVWLGEEHGRWDVRAELSSISCPVLALQGDHDEFGSDAQLTAIQERVADATVWRIAGAGHAPHNEVPGEFCALVADFWATLGGVD